VDRSRCVIVAGSNTGSVSATETGASKPALPARQSNTKVRCQSISYGVRMTVVETGAARAGDVRRIRSLLNARLVGRDYRGERQNDMHVAAIPITLA
jgi:hypothetical protein